MSVHDTIRTIRELNQWTQEDMAEKLDISVNGYSKIERGKSKLTLEKLEQIANIFNINVSDLYSAKEKGFFCLFSENSQNNSNIYANTDAVVFENEKLSLIIQHKDEIIKRQEDEISTLREMINYYKINKTRFTNLFDIILAIKSGNFSLFLLHLKIQIPIDVELF